MGFICEVFQFIVFTRCSFNCLVLNNLALKLFEMFRILASLERAAS